MRYNSAKWHHEVECMNGNNGGIIRSIVSVECGDMLMYSACFFFVVFSVVLQSGINK